MIRIAHKQRRGGCCIATAIFVLLSGLVPPGRGSDRQSSSAAVDPPAPTSPTGKPNAGESQKADSTSLHDAASKGDVDQLRRLVEQGADVNAVDGEGRTALHKAAVDGRDEAVKFLLDHGVDVNAKDGNARTPLELMSETAGKLWESGQPIPRSYEKVGELLIFRGATMGGKKLTDTMMHRYAFGYGIEQAKEALEKGANVNGRDEHGQTALHLAAFAGTIDRMELFLQYGADVNARDEHGRTPLHEAAGRGRVEAVKLLLGRGADVQAVDRGGSTPLHNVAQAMIREVEGEFSHHDGEGPQGDYAGTCERLLQSGIPVDAKGFRGDTPLHGAAAGAYRDVAEVLLKHGADLNAKNDAGETPCHKTVEYIAFLDQDASRVGVEHLYPTQIAKRERYKEFLAWLQERGAIDSPPAAEAAARKAKEREAAKSAPCDPESIMEESFPPLFGARTTDAVERILADGADVNVVNQMGQTAMHWAVERGRVEVLRSLIKRGARVDAKDGSGRTPLHQAAEHGHAELASILLDSGADVAAQDRSRYTSLHMLASGRQFWDSPDEKPGDDKRDYVATAKVLLDHGAAVGAKGSQGKTPLHLASQYGDKEFASLFLSRGADVNAVDESGATPLHAAASGRALWMTGGAGSKHKPVLYGEIAELLISKGATVDATDTIGDTPLHVVGMSCDPEVAKILLTHKADLKARTIHGETPLKAAERGLQDLKSMAGQLPQADVAERSKCYEEMIRLLREKGAE